jgi:putative acetyltransferase
MEVHFQIASTIEEFNIARSLFEEYAAALNVDLCFQGFDEELQTLHLQYNLPKGCLMLVGVDEHVVGCAAIREFENNIAELKRMYLKPECRGKGIGKKLLHLMFYKAIELGYVIMRLDTLPQMTEAQQLYKQCGFQEIGSYRFNPVAGTVYMEKKLVK